MMDLLWRLGSLLIYIWTSVFVYFLVVSLYSVCMEHNVFERIYNWLTIPVRWLWHGPAHYRELQQEDEALIARIGESIEAIQRVSSDVSAARSPIVATAIAAMRSDAARVASLPTGRTEMMFEVVSGMATFIAPSGEVIRLTDGGSVRLEYGFGRMTVTGQNFRTIVDERITITKENERELILTAHVAAGYVKLLKELNAIFVAWKNKEAREDSSPEQMMSSQAGDNLGIAIDVLADVLEIMGAPRHIVDAYSCNDINDLPSPELLERDCTAAVRYCLGVTNKDELPVCEFEWWEVKHQPVRALRGRKRVPRAKVKWDGTGPIKRNRRGK